MNKAYAYGKSVRITAESLGIAIPAFGTITVMFCVTSEISVIIIVYITSGLGDGDKNLSCQRHTWGACHYSLPSYLLCPRAFKLWGALPEGVMLIIKSNLSSRIVSTNTSAQLFIAALGTSAISRIRNPFLVCPCEDQSPPQQQKWPTSLLARVSGCLYWCHWDVPSTSSLSYLSQRTMTHHYCHVKETEATNHIWPRGAGGANQV